MVKGRLPKHGCAASRYHLLYDEIGQGVTELGTFAPPPDHMTDY